MSLCQCECCTLFVVVRDRLPRLVLTCILLHHFYNYFCRFQRKCALLKINRPCGLSHCSCIVLIVTFLFAIIVLDFWLNKIYYRRRAARALLLFDK